MEPLPKFKSEKIFGRNACRAVWKQRPQDIMRAALTKDMLTAFSECLRDLADNKVSYRVVDDEELCKIAGSDHHEGICFQVRARKFLGEESIRDVIEKDNVVVCLDGVGNPHNFGALVRSAVNFGVKTILGDEELPSLSGAGSRVSEGASEFIDLLKVDDIVDALADFRDGGFKLYALDNKGGKSLYDTEFPRKSLFIMGAEGKGISSGLKKLADGIITIPGTGSVESLNVSVAAGLVLGEYWRQSESLKDNRPSSTSGGKKSLPKQDWSSRQFSGRKNFRK
jgi:TrmH RNA methyltransferase